MSKIEALRPLPPLPADLGLSYGNCRSGGASRDRTDDLKLAKLALSQLSYGPIGSSLLASLVGREGVEPSTSRLSGVRSNHLSYRPPNSPAGHEGRGRREPAQAALRRRQLPGAWKRFRMKGHEDGGMFFGQEEKSVSCFCRHDP